MIAQLRARMWEEFTGRTIAALREAAALLVGQGLGYDHSQSQGYWGSGTRSIRQHKVHLPQENAITHVLVEALEIVRRNASADDLLSRQQICFPSQQPRPMQKRVGSKALTTDIQARSLQLPYLDLRIEAKVLFGSADADHYCGDRGLLRFSDVEPYTDQPVGMMLGYTVRHADPHWLKLIQTKASTDARVKNFGLVDIGGENVLGSTLASHATGEVIVLHVLLPFETAPSARELDASQG